MLAFVRVTALPLDEFPLSFFFPLPPSREFETGIDIGIYKVVGGGGDVRMLEDIRIIFRKEEISRGRFLGKNWKENGCKWVLIERNETRVF